MGSVNERVLFCVRRLGVNVGSADRWCTATWGWRGGSRRGACRGRNGHACRGTPWKSCLLSRVDDRLRAVQRAPRGGGGIEGCLRLAPVRAAPWAPCSNVGGPYWSGVVCLRNTCGLLLVVSWPCPLSLPHCTLFVSVLRTARARNLGLPAPATVSAAPAGRGGLGGVLSFDPHEASAPVGLDDLRGEQCG